jgi:hypothetical protein
MISSGEFMSDPFGVEKQKALPVTQGFALG